MARTKKPKVEISAGALIVVELPDGGQRRFNCTCATRPGRSPDKVIKDIQDCVRSSNTKATKSK